MKIKNKKASIFVYTLILINVALIIWYVVFNNTYILNNNINIWKNAEEVFLKLSDKWNINIESVRQYNRNWGWFWDVISCPTNITMSWTTNITSGIISEMFYDFGTVYCAFDFNWERVRLYFDVDTQDFTRVYFDWDLKDIVNEAVYGTTAINTTNWSVWVSWSEPNSNSNNDKPVRAIDGDINSTYQSKTLNWSNIVFDLWSEKKLSKIIIYKKLRNWNSFWDTWNVILKNWWNTVLKTIGITWARWSEEIHKSLWYSAYNTAAGVRYIQIQSTWWSTRMDVAEIAIFELNQNPEDRWRADSPFSDSDQTLFYFDSTGIGWNDGIDDNMNSDDYIPWSRDSITYPGNFIDDDVTPRLTIFGSVSPEITDYHNVFWNNYLTNEMINDNPYNNDSSDIISKIWDVSRWYLFFDIFAKTDDELSYDMKIIEFDRDAYVNRNTLLPINIWESTNLTQNYWYLQRIWSNLSLSRFKTWNEFEFNFRDKDYAIFFTNKLWVNLSVRITWEERPASWNINELWKNIYINPIDESETGIIKTIANHIIIGWEKNFIWENFTVIWPK